MPGSCVASWAIAGAASIPTRANPTAASFILVIGISFGHLLCVWRANRRRRMPFRRCIQRTVNPPLGTVRVHAQADVPGGSNLCLVGSDPHQLLAEIGALQQAHERGWRAVEAFGDELLV